MSGLWNAVMPHTVRDWIICTVTLAVIAAITVRQEMQARKKERAEPCPHWAALPAMYPDGCTTAGPPPNFDRCPWCGAVWPERENV